MIMLTALSWFLCNYWPLCSSPIKKYPWQFTATQ